MYRQNLSLIYTDEVLQMCLMITLITCPNPKLYIRGLYTGLELELSTPYLVLSSAQVIWD